MNLRDTDIADRKFQKDLNAGIIALVLLITTLPAHLDAEAERVASLCHRSAERFARGGRLLATAAFPAAWSDARHVAVEFVHPVIVGKRALPAMALDPGRVALMARPDEVGTAAEAIAAEQEAQAAEEPAQASEEAPEPEKPE